MKKRSKWYISKTTKIKLNISNETIKKHNETKIIFNL